MDSESELWEWSGRGVGLSNGGELKGVLPFALRKVRNLELQNQTEIELNSGSELGKNRAESVGLSNGGGLKGN